jgi:hypothetical protein
MFLLLLVSLYIRIPHSFGSLSPPVLDGASFTVASCLPHILSLILLQPVTVADYDVSKLKNPDIVTNVSEITATEITTTSDMLVSCIIDYRPHYSNYL